MPSLSKPLKILLPLATATTATIFTVYLVATFTKELNKKNDQDTLLDNLDLEIKPFEEELIAEKEHQEASSDEEDTSKSEPNEAVPKDKENSLTEDSSANIDQMVNSLRDQVADMMEQGKDLQEVNVMNLQIPDTVKQQSPSSEKSSPPREPEQKESSDLSNPKAGNREQTPLGDNSEIQEGIHSGREKEDKDSSVTASAPQGEMQREEASPPNDETVATQSDLSNNLSEPVEEELMSPLIEQKDGEIPSSEGEDITQDSDLPAAGETVAEDVSHGKNENGSDDESVTMTDEQIEKLLN